MQNKKLPIIITVIIFVILCSIFMIMSISYSNQQVRLVNQYKAEEQVIEATYDNMWKSIKQIAQVADNYKESFKEVYNNILDKRYDKDNGMLLNWLKESNPQFDPAVYEQLAVVIEVEREKFLNAQTKILDVVREQNNLLDQIPSKWFLSDCERLKYEVVSSNTTKKVMETRMEENIDVFDK